VQKGKADLPFIIFHFSSAIAERKSDEFDIEILKVVVMSNENEDVTIEWK
jgi:hypothetical protein